MAARRRGRRSGWSSPPSSAGPPAGSTTPPPTGTGPCWHALGLPTTYDAGRAGRSCCEAMRRGQEDPRRPAAVRRARRAGPARRSWTARTRRCWPRPGRPSRRTAAPAGSVGRVTASAVRRDRLRAAARAAGLDAVLVTDLVNVRYLTGFTGSNAALLVPAGADRPEVLCTDGRYTAQAGEQSPDVERLIERDRAVGAGRAGGQDGYRTLGFETHDVTVDLRAALAEAAGGELVSVKRAVEQLRAVKDDDEIGAAAGGLRGRRPGARRADRRRRHPARAAPSARSASTSTTGCATSAPSAVVRDDRGGRAEQRHPAPPADRRGAGAPATSSSSTSAPTVDGYHSDMTRTFVLGRPADWQREIYQLVHAAQAAGRAALRDRRARSRSVDAAARDVIADGRAGPSSSRTGSGTASGWRSTRRRRWPRSAPVRWQPAWASPSSPGSTFRGAAASASRTPSWSARAPSRAAHADLQGPHGRV